MKNPTFKELLNDFKVYSEYEEKNRFSDTYKKYRNQTTNLYSFLGEFDLFLY